MEALSEVVVEHRSACTSASGPLQSPPKQWLKQPVHTTLQLQGTNPWRLGLEHMNQAGRHDQRAKKLRPGGVACLDRRIGRLGRLPRQIHRLLYLLQVHKVLRSVTKVLPEESSALEYLPAAQARGDANQPRHRTASQYDTSGVDLLGQYAIQ
jgi:hypothetical protein